MHKATNDNDIASLRGDGRTTSVRLGLCLGALSVVLYVVSLFMLFGVYYLFRFVV